MIFDANKIKNIEEDITNLINSFTFDDRCIFIRCSPCFKSFFYEEKIKKLLDSKYKVYSLKNIINSNCKEDKKGYFQKIIEKISTSLLGFIPTLGNYISVILLILDLTKDTFDRTKINEIKNQLIKKGRKHKEYKKVKYIIYINDFSSLSQQELLCLQLISFLIAQKYIVNTAILQIQNIEVQMPYLSNSKLGKEYNINQIVIDNINLESPLNHNCLTILNIIGVEFFQYLNEAMMQEHTIDQTIDVIIKSLLEDKNIKNDETLGKFLTTCSLLFEQFELKDVEHIAHLQHNNEHKLLLEQAKSAEIIQCLNFQKFYFIQPFLREFYQQQHYVFPSDFYNNVYEHLQKKYPNAIEDLAIAASLLLTDDYVIFSKNLLAYYKSSFYMPKYKLNKIIDNLEKCKLGKLILKIDDLYNHYENDISEAREACQEAFDLLQVTKISIEAKLAAMSFISRLYYELNEPQEKLIKFCSYYKKLLASTNVFTEDIKDESSYYINWNYVLDFIAFSTCIEDNYEIHHISQKLAFRLEKVDVEKISKEKYIKFLRLGNAVYPQDTKKAKELLLKGYEISKEIPFIHKLFIINYSSCLIVDSNYDEAIKELGQLIHQDKGNNAIKLSVENNYYIALFLSNKISANHSIDIFANYYGKEFKSDYCICINNYISLKIMNNDTNFNNEIITCYKIINTNDLYHKFYATHNLIVIYFLIKDSRIWQLLEKQSIPYLLKHYEPMYEEKLLFFKQNFNKNWDIQFTAKTLSNHLQNTGFSQFSSFYKLPVLFGMIERWFE